ncbi:MAG: YggS family pyridoxal phosphate-dependent enzyme [Aquisalimonadaceae bacterium]
MTTIAQRLAAVRKRISDAERLHGRPAGSVRLLAVSKTRQADELRQTLAQGQTAFGENYLQEARQKQDALHGAGIEWHFIGPLQANKTNPVATYFDWVHSVDRLKLATRLNAQRPANLPPLNVCLQVNISREPTKAGLAAEHAAELADAIGGLDRLRLRGLMCIPAPAESESARRAPFRALKELQDQLIASGHDLDTLSMGMSGDLEAAIAEGATLVRVGTDIFGSRTPASAGGNESPELGSSRHG